MTVCISISPDDGVRVSSAGCLECVAVAAGAPSVAAGAAFGDGAPGNHTQHELLNN